MAQFLMIGVGAGVVSALLTLVVATGSPLALALFFASPLPIAIAALGWNHKAGLVAAAVGALILALSPIAFGGGVNLRMAAVHALSSSLPAWWFSYLILLARPGPEGPEWYPIGRVLAWIACLAAAATIAGVVSIATDYDAFVRAFGRMVDLIERINPALFERTPPDLKPQARAAIAATLAGLAPPVSAALSVWISAGLLAVAGRVTLASGRLPRPWPHLPSIVLPKALISVLAATFAGSLLPGFPGLVMRTIFAAFLAAYALQGLALAHALTAGRPGRIALLAPIYVTSVVLGGWPLIIAAVAGVIDSVFNIRAKRGLAARDG